MTLFICITLHESNRTKWKTWPNLFQNWNTAAITTITKLGQWQGDLLIFHVSRQILLEHNLLNTTVKLIGTTLRKHSQTLSPAEHRNPKITTLLKKHFLNKYWSSIEKYHKTNMPRKASVQKQSSRGVLKKMCSENMQQIYRRTPMPKQLYWNRISAWVFCCKFSAYFQNTFS